MILLLLSIATAALCLICGAAYIYLNKRYRYWKDRGVPGPEPIMILGNMKEAYSLKCTEPQMMDSWYKKYRNEPYIGFYNLWKPSILLIDPEYIKKITKVDFNHFTDHPHVAGNSKSDGISDSLFLMKGERWKLKRQYFSGLFTPKRLRDYSEQASIKQYNNSLLEEIDKHLESNDEIDLLEVIRRYVLKINMSSLYGIDLSNDEERIQKLKEYSLMFLKPNFDTFLKFVLYSVCPDLLSWLNMSTFPAAFWNYFSHFTKELIDFRKGVKSDHKDLVTMIKNLKDGDGIQNEKIDFSEAVGHVFSFFSASNHTTQTTLCYALFQLGQNPDVQEKLKNEIDMVLNGTEDFSYERINKMTFMDNVLNETMRLHPLLGILKRICTEIFQIDNKFCIPEGMEIIIPVESVHMDPEYFPEPEKFLPERFSGSDKLPFVFMPFGKGPRLCIGSRMAFLFMKIGLARILSRYTILPSLKSTQPIKYDPKIFFITCRPLNGLWVQMRKREQK